MKENIMSSIGQPKIHRDLEKKYNKISFQERIDRAKKNTENVIENANMVAVANQLLDNYSLQEINSINEKEINKTCEPYDAAVIVAICQTIEKNKQASN